MSDPRPTARATIYDWYASANGAAMSDEHANRLVAAVEADRAASDAREDRPREALEEIRNDWRPHARRESACDPFTVADSALVAIPPRSDR